MIPINDPVERVVLVVAALLPTGAVLGSAEGKAVGRIDPPPPTLVGFGDVAGETETGTEDGL